jgi:hypothetical protein
MLPTPILTQRAISERTSERYARASERKGRRTGRLCAPRKMARLAMQDQVVIMPCLPAWPRSAWSGKESTKRVTFSVGSSQRQIGSAVSAARPILWAWPRRPNPQSRRAGTFTRLRRRPCGSAQWRRQIKAPLSRRPLRNSKLRYGVCTRCSTDDPS